MPDTPLIAVIDDDASSRGAISGLVQSLGFRTASFASPQEFLSASVRVDCLIVDVRMPGMSGIDLVRHLSTSRKLGSVILVTAHPDETTRRSAARGGIRCYLAKPVNPDELADCLRKALSTCS